ncbi:hypothetical protein FQR65_LT11376 [Abscondita terminalis]|nr:hypothetical protein FQR65_LT11376 [Abscondita terminalis]
MGNLSKRTPFRAHKVNARSKKIKATHAKIRTSRISTNDSKGTLELNKVPEFAIDVTMESNDTLSSDLPDLEIEMDMSDTLYGRRLINLPQILDQYKDIVLHKFRCTTGDMRYQREIRNGLFTTLELYCDNCEKRSMIISDPTKNEINDGLVWGCLSSGIGYHQCEEIFGYVPIMTAKTFARKTTTLKKAWKDILTIKMQEAGEEERRIALQKGHVTTSGVPYIAVV